MSSYAFHTTYKNNPLFHAQEHTSYLISHDNIDLNSEIIGMDIESRTC